MNDAIEGLQRRAAADSRVIGLAGGLPSVSQFPRAALARAFLGALTRPEAPGLQYGWPEGSASLRRRIAERLRARGAEVSENDVIVTSGAQQAIAIAVDLLCQRGDRIAVAPATYPAALELFRRRGLCPVLGSSGARAVYALPAVGNPDGRALSGHERRRLLASDVPIIEDDAYAELRWTGVPAPLLAAARAKVFHVGTFSKTLCPGLRVGWLVPPAKFRKRAVRLKQAGDLQAGSLAQEIVDSYLAATDFDHHLRRLRRFYRLRAHRMAASLKRHLPGWRFDEPDGGFALWVFPDVSIPERLLLAAAIDGGVSFDPGSMFRPDGAGQPLALRLCYSTLPAPQIEEGVRRLARAVRKLVPQGRYAGRPTATASAG